MRYANFTLSQILRQEDNGCGCPEPLPLFPNWKRSVFVAAVTILVAVMLVRLAVP